MVESTTTSPQIKAKIFYHEVSLSALAISNLISASASQIAFAKAPKPNTDRNEFYWVELRIDIPGLQEPTKINSELAIMDFVAHHAGLARQGTAESVSFDDLAHVLNSRLRGATTSFAVTKDGADVKDIIKQIAKDLEERAILETLADKNTPK